MTGRFWQVALLLIPFALVCLTLAPQARATCQQGCLTNQNTVLGDDALIANTGFFNTAIGFEALSSNTVGGVNTAIGYQALWLNTTGGYNTAVGFAALQSNTFGAGNTATGYGALNGNTTGAFNVAAGESALANNTTGTLNIALGFQAGQNLTTGRNNIDIGNLGVAGESKTIRMGKQGTHTTTFIAGISGATVPTGVPVIIDTTGHLGTTTSSSRYKDNVQPMDNTSEAILALKPVTFRYKHDLDPDGNPQFGLIAEDVEKVNPDLVARDEQGKPYTVRYEAVNAMLLNEFLKEHRKVKHQETTITNLKSAMVQQRKDFETSLAEQQKQIEALTAGLQKVSAQLEISKSVLQTIANNQ